MTTAALNLELTPSRWLAGALVAGHGLALTAAWFSALPWWAALMLSGAIAFSGAWHWRRHRRPRWRRLCVDPAGWRLLGDKVEHIVHPVGEAYVSPWLTVLQVARDDGRREALVLLPDSGDKDQLRRLRVWLRMVSPLSRKPARGVTIGQ